MKKIYYGKRIKNVIEKKHNEAIFKLSYDDDTLICFPFLFELYIKYLIEDDELIIELLINNLDDKNLYASCGTHPGFDILKSNDFLGDNISIIYDKKNANQLYFDDNGYVIDNKFKKIVNSDFQEFIDKVIYEKILCYEGI